MTAVDDIFTDQRTATRVSMTSGDNMLTDQRTAA